MKYIQDYSKNCTKYIIGKAKFVNFQNFLSLLWTEENTETCEFVNYIRKLKCYQRCVFYQKIEDVNISAVSS